MTQYIGQITVIIEAEDESVAESRLRAIAKHVEDEGDGVDFADHNGDVENYEELEAECQKSLESGPAASDAELKKANAHLAATAPRLLAALIVCADLLADYDEAEGEEGDAYREAVDAIAEAEAFGRAA
jgi:hypothetical protein